MVYLYHCIDEEGFNMSSQFSMKSYMKGALLLTIASLIVKVLSAIYRVPFQNMVGDQGFMCISRFIHSFHFCRMDVWRICGRHFKIISWYREWTNKTWDYHDSVSIFNTIICALFLSLVFGADLLSSWMGDAMLAPFKTGAFVTLFMPALAVMKGIFQSRAMMQPVAYAQVLSNLSEWLSF